MGQHTISAVRPASNVVLTPYYSAFAVDGATSRKHLHLRFIAGDTFSTSGGLAVVMIWGIPAAPIFHTSDVVSPETDTLTGAPIVGAALAGSATANAVP